MRKITIIGNSSATVPKILGYLEDQRPQIQLSITEPFFDQEVENEIIEFQPHVILLDLLLVESVDSGLSVLQEIKKSRVLARVPVVIWSHQITGDQKGSRLWNSARRLGAADALNSMTTSKDDFLESIERVMAVK
jgi:CheY-like chemotaxis protein